MSAAFYTDKKEAKRELKVNFNNKTLPFCSEPKYLGVTLDRSLTYRRHLESLHKKLTSCVAFLRRHAGYGWVAGATTLPTFNCRVLQSCLVLCSSYLPYRSRHQRRLMNCDWMPATYTRGQSSNLRRHPTYWASLQWSHTFSSMLCRAAWTPTLLSAHLPIECKCMVPQIERCTQLYLPHNNSSVHLTTTYVRHSGIINGMQSGRTTPQDSALSSPTLAPTTRNDPPKKSLGPA